MKAMIISVLLFITVNAQNIWYVDKNATGTSTGRSWANAWRNLDSIWISSNEGVNWQVIQDGDTILVAAGTYYNQSARGNVNSAPPFTGTNAGRTWITRPVVKPAWDATHGGTVYLKASGGGTCLSTSCLSNILFYDLDIVYDDTQAGEMVLAENDSFVVFNNCRFTSNGYGGAIGLQVSNQDTVKKCIIYHQENSLATEQDPFGISGGGGGHVIDNCLIWQNNHDLVQGGPHKDMIQISDIGDANGYTNVISNNLLINMSTNMTDCNAIIYNDGLIGDQNFLIYNNIMYSRGTESLYGDYTAIYMGNHPNGYNQKVEILNNTIITKGNGTGITINCDWMDTLIIKNNLFICDTTAQNFINIGNNIGNGTAAANHLDFDYNFFAELGEIETGFGFYVGGQRTFTYWQNTLGFDDNSDTTNLGNITWSAKGDTNYAGYYTTNGNGLGVDLSSTYPFLAKDKAGNTRSNWDIGALEFNGNQSGNVNVKAKIYLQGPFNSNSMLTALNQGGFLPNYQPYNAPPWNYTGNENLGSGPNSTMVDWVLVELRSASNPSQVVARRAAVLKNDGLLLNTNGSEGIAFNNVNPGSYYIAIFHRDHLAIMSAAPVPLSSNSAIYDFTNGMNKAYGQNPMVELVTGKFGMFAADGNADGVVNIADRDDVWLIQNGNMGYLEGDFNMDSGVTVHDVNQLWNINNGAVTRVP